MDGRLLMLGWAALGAVCALAAVKEEVRVSDFGWDAADATKCVQTALDSGAWRVVFDRQTGPWVVAPVKARSNTDIVFEDGVELVAKRGEFHGKYDCLLEFAGVTNVALVGRGEKGGILRMHKAEYQNVPYSPSEYRHTLAVFGSVGIRIENMSFIDSGGDGILISGQKGGLGCCRDVTIRHCVCDGNNRQGISVCSVENLLVEDTVLRNTKGRLPQAGIDFEPDWPSHRIVNCVMRRCRFEGNAGNGVLVYLAAQSATSRPIGVTIEDCVMSGNRGNGISVRVGGSVRNSPPQGAIRFRNCHIEGNARGSIEINEKPTDFPLVFADCTITNQKQGVTFCVSGWEGPLPDGIEFRHLTAYCNAGIDWMQPRPQSRGLNPFVPTNITGDVEVVRPGGRRERVAIDDEWSTRRFVIATGRMPPARMEKWPDVSVCTVRDTAPGRMVPLAPVRRRSSWRGVRYAFFADRPGEAHFRGRYVQDKPGPFGEEPLFLVGRGRYSHQQKSIASLPQLGTNSTEFSISIPKRGFYWISGQAFLSSFVLEEADVPVAIDVHAPIQLQPPSDGTACMMYLYIPDGTVEFAVLAKGAIEAKLFAPSGELAASRGSDAAWSALQIQNPNRGLWSIDLRGKAADTLDLTGVPSLLWLSSAKTVAW